MRIQKLSWPVCIEISTMLNYPTHLWLNCKEYNIWYQRLSSVTDKMNVMIHLFEFSSFWMTDLSFSLLAFLPPVKLTCHSDDGIAPRGQEICDQGGERKFLLQSISPPPLKKEPPQSWKKQPPALKSCALEPTQLQRPGLLLSLWFHLLPSHPSLSSSATFKGSRISPGLP